MPSGPSIVVDETIRAAIADRRLVSFELDGLPRIAEPHDYGVSNGVLQLFFYQVGGKSSSGAPLGWRTAVIVQGIGDQGPGTTLCGAAARTVGPTQALG